MNKQQLESMSKFTEAHKYALNHSGGADSYNAKDAGVVLEIVKQQEEKLESLKEDLKTIREYLETGKNNNGWIDQFLLGMVDSSLALIEV